MSDLIKKQAVRTAIQFIGKESIVEAAEEFLRELISFKNTIELQEGETDVIGILYEKSGITYCGAAVINDQDQICRYLATQRVSEAISDIIDKI